MPFADIRIAGTASRAPFTIVADATRAVGARLGKPASAMEASIIKNYGAGGLLIADRPASPAQEVASANGKR